LVRVRVRVKVAVRVRRVGVGFGLVTYIAFHLPKMTSRQFGRWKQVLTEIYRVFSRLRDGKWGEADNLIT
jgi:hypothetical protein